MKSSVAILQGSFSKDTQDNIQKVEDWVVSAAKEGANIICPPELFENHYFCKTQNEELFANAKPLADNQAVLHFQKLCKTLGVVMPVSFFERVNQACFNSVAMIDQHGDILGVYQKTHIPDGPGYQEKFYFKPGTTGFKVWKTAFGNVGVGICWDQWFPECARAMVLAGADVLLYPTAIGSEPHMPDMDTKDPWQRVMQGHAVANACVVAAANRTGKEADMEFYGSSFVCDGRGDMLCEMNRTEEGFRIAEIDLAALQHYRDSFGFFRDRRPSHYKSLTKET